MVGSILGREGVNINFMSVAPASYQGLSLNSEKKPNGLLAGAASAGPVSTAKEAEEALMILGVDREAGNEVVKELVSGGGVLSVSNVML